MKKHFCDICLQEIDDESVDVFIHGDTFYKSHEYCHTCFLDRKNWKKIHTIPDKQLARPIKLSDAINL